MTTTTKCIVCDKEFVYYGYKNKCCSNSCLSKYREQLTTKQRGLNYENVIIKIEKYIVDNYNTHGVVKTLKECLKDMHISSKTFYKYCKKYNISYGEILSRNNISRQHSKFQTAITSFVKQIYNGHQTIEEATFDDCRNPKTNYLLRFDIYIKDMNLIIECDGVQHSIENSYFNTLTLESGHTPTYVTDEIKNEYCNKNNIKIIRIPYSSIVTRDYVESFLCAQII